MSHITAGIDITLHGSTQQGVLFVGSDRSLSQDTNNFSWDETNHRLGLGTDQPQFQLDATSFIKTRSGIVYPDGTVQTSASSGGGGSLTIGDAIASGTANRVLYEDSSNQLAETSGLEFDGEKLNLNSTSTIALTNQSTAKIPSGSSLTFSATVSSGDTILVVFGYQVQLGPATLSATFNGVSMTTAESVLFGTNRAEVWYMVNPPVGTYDVVITSGGTLGGYLAGYALSFSGVDVTSPILSSDSVFYGNVDATNFTSITLGTSPGSLALSFLGTSVFAAWPVTAGDGESILYSTNPLAVSMKSGGTTMSWTLAGDSALAHIGVSLSALSTRTEVTSSSIATGDLVVDSFEMPTGASDGYVLTSDGSGNASWSDPTTIETPRDKEYSFTIDGGSGSLIATGAKKAYVRVGANFTPTSWEAVADQSGYIKFNIWKDTYENFPPTVADSVVGSNFPVISSAIKAQGTSLSGWNTAWNKGDYLELSVDACTSVTKAILTVIGTERSF